MSAIRDSAVRELLHGVGLRCTATRERILAVLLDTGHPLSHAQILTRLEGSTIDRVTGYRTLAALERNGLVHRVLGIDGSWRFCAHRVVSTGCPGDHAHFFCVDCGAMHCLLDQRLPWLTVGEGYRVVAKQLVAFGQCPRCARQDREPSLQPPGPDEGGGHSPSVSSPGTDPVPTGEGG
ncbi:MAG: transcriptional repressor [Bradymonadales bacterium]|nr:transcriptional repressor [Bradymonadales bacterium]